LSEAASSASVVVDVVRCWRRTESRRRQRCFIKVGGDFVGEVSAKTVVGELQRRSDQEVWCRSQEESWPNAVVATSSRTASFKIAASANVVVAVAGSVVLVVDVVEQRRGRRRRDQSARSCFGVTASSASVVVEDVTTGKMTTVEKRVKVEGSFCTLFGVQKECKNQRAKGRNR
jgi:hypothetical protein